ncbi:MAG: acyl carrier protein [Porcipelethomonas sp.]
MIEKVIEILSEFTEMKPEQMNRDTKLVADMGLNSFDVVNVVVSFEEEFDIEIPDRAIRDLQTVGNIVEYLESHV